MPARGERGRAGGIVMRRLSSIVLSCAIAFIAGCGLVPDAGMQLPAPEPVPIYDHTITPNRAGPVSLGMPGAQVLSMYGSPSRSIDGTTYTMAIWSSPNISVSIRHDTQQVCSIEVSDNSYATEGGVGVGSTQFDMRLKLGNPTSMYYPPGGVWRANYSNYGYAIFGYTSDGRITAIYIGFGSYCQ